MRLDIQRLALAAAAFALPSVAHAATPTDGPKSLLITYRTDAARRPAFRHYLAHEELARLAEWKKQGVIANYQILFNPYRNEDTWDAMLVLRFKDYADTVRWQQIERDNPGGLAPEGLALGQPNNTYSADADWEGGKDTAAADRDAVFYVIPYEYKNEAEYRSYFEGYVLPQVKGWMESGVLTGYRIFMNRFGVGRPWDALFIYRYRDNAGFGQRPATIAKVRAVLKDNPEWVKWSQNKTDLRTEAENTIAGALQPE